MKIRPKLVACSPRYGSTKNFRTLQNLHELRMHYSNFKFHHFSTRFGVSNSIPKAAFVCVGMGIGGADIPTLNSY